MITLSNELDTCFSHASVRSNVIPHLHFGANASASIGALNYSNGIIELYDEIVSRQVSRCLLNFSTDDFRFFSSSRLIVSRCQLTFWNCLENSKWWPHENLSFERNDNSFRSVSSFVHGVFLGRASVSRISFVRPSEPFSFSFGRTSKVFWTII